jgi:TPR repeat protein
MKTISSPARCGGQVSGRALAGIIIVAVVILAAIFLVLRKPEPEPVPEPDRRPVETVEPARSEEERGDSAREVIAMLKASPVEIDYAAAHVRAQEFQAAGRLADAQLLYFFAARGGHGPAAFDLATMYDPNHYSSETSLLEEPDAFQAYKWYTEAQRADYPAAEERLADLRASAEEAARTGDPEAERLLLQWE